MSTTETNVHTLTGDQPETDPLARAEAAMSAAIDELRRRSDDNSGISAELIEAREDVRTEYRRQRRNASGRTGSRPAPEKFLPGTDDELGEFLATGADHARDGAKTTALRSARALCEILTAINEGESTTKVHPEEWSRVAWMASSLVERAMELDKHGKGGNDGE